MAVFVPGTGVAPADLFEDLSRDLVEQYRAAEARILAKVQRQIDRQLEDPTALPDPRLLEQLAQTRAALANVEAAARRLELDPNLADEAVRTAVAEGSAAAADRLGLVDVFPTTGPITSTAASATVQVALDLRSRLDDVKLRILRFEEDAYQRIIAQALPPVLLGTTYSIDQQRATVARWLADGIPAFVDKSGRRWSTGAYVEMATRTGLSRAYTEASIARQQQVGVDLVTIVVGASACRSCAQWIGKILSTSGQTGTVVLPHATNGAPTVVHIADTLGHARSSSHLNGPNCRCIAVAYLPGLSIPVAATAYDPAKEAARDKQRELERRLRSLKTRLALSPSEDEQAALRARIRATQGTLRAHIAEHDLPRKAYREQPSWAHGKPPAAPPPEPVIPEPPAPPAAPPPSIRSEIGSMTSAQAAEHAATRHGMPFEDWDGVPHEVGREAVGIVSDLLDRFPARFKTISARRNDGVRIPRGTLAYVLGKEGDALGEMHFVRATLTKARLVDVAKRAKASHHAVDFGETWQDELRHITTHEFVHGLDRNVGGELTKLYAREYRAATEGKPYPEQRAFRLAAGIPSYAMKNYGEGVAEMLALALEKGDDAPEFARTLLAKALPILEDRL